MTKAVSDKENYSINRLEKFKDNLVKSTELNKQKDLCIYTTGSYGRLEASEFSDIDLFFLHENDKKEFSNIDKILIDAHIINISRKLDFPEFSGDGEYLEIHKTSDIYDKLGSREDDYYNYFTARMLLLLESKPIFNNNLHDKIIETTIDKYYRDFHEHEKNFKPVFIVNDVIRFWRTMCLNYEHNRNRKFESLGKMSKEEVEIKKGESHIKNLKLKFSRKLTCYSFLLSILHGKKVLSKADLKNISDQTPLQRLINLRDNQDIKDDVNAMIDLYFWFLGTTQIEKVRLIDWILNQENRDLAFDKSREFAKIIYNIMISAKNKDNLIYFLI